MSSKKYRIKDIANLAGVSVGTVDRVLHNRGRVSQAAMSKVQEALLKIDYKPNLIARTLGSKKAHRIAVLVPQPDQDEYWAQSNNGVKQAQLEWAQFGFQIENYYFDLYDKNSFKKVAKTVYSDKPDGLLIAPVFYQETLPFFDLYKSISIPFVLFNTNIPEVEPLSFIGQNLFESGKVGGELSYLVQQKPGIYAILHIYEDIQNSVHLKEKEKGFRQFFVETQHPNINIKTLDLSNAEEALVESELNSLLSDPQLKGVLVTTSKGLFMVASLLQKRGKKGISLIGYDLLEQNITYLKSGIIDFLINQNPKQQSFLGISHLANYLLFKKDPPRRDLFPLEVVTRQNLNSYLASRMH
jgi:LacI family transcriptional regulator